MTPSIPDDLLSRAARWEALKRWERRELGQELRRLGLSYREIREVIPVAQATLSGWCRELELTTEQLLRLHQLRPSVAARSQAGMRRRNRNAARVNAIVMSARVEAGELLNDPLWIAGVVAYWAEGSKRSGEVQFSNSDPDLVRLFVRWTSTFLGVTSDQLAVQLHLHTGQEEVECKTFWSDVIGIGPHQFRKTFIKPEGTGHRKNVLYNGTASVRVRRSGDRLHRIRGWIEAVANHWGPLAQPARAGAS